MLFCHDGRKNPCEAKKFEETFVNDPLLGEMGKFPIYARRGESAFYGSSLFGSTVDFLDRHGVATFSYARANQGEMTTLTGPSVRFLRGASHRQLSMKSENVVLVPYGTDVANGKLAEIVTPKRRCEGVAFNSVEVTEFMGHLCREECKNRPAPRKLKDPTKAHRTRQTANGETIREVYDPIGYENGSNLTTNGKMLQSWCEQENEKNREFQEDGESFLKTAPRGRFCYFVNNYYVSGDLLTKLTETCAAATEAERKTCFGSRFFPRVTAALEEHSSDVKIWKITWDFY